MTTGFGRRFSFTVLTVLLCAVDSGRSDEPKAAVKPVQVQVIRVDAVPLQAVIQVEAVVDQAAEAKPAKAEPQPVHAEPAKAKPKGAAAAFDIEALAAPFVEALEGKLDLNGNNAQVNAQLQQWIPHFTQQFRPILLAELNFIRQHCDLAKEQRPKIKAAGEAALTAAVRKMAEQQMGNRGGMQGAADPRRTIRDALAKALKETLTAEQMAKYTEQANQRAALRKRAAILNVVARLDTIMCLTAEQRGKITESISAAWQENWEQWLFLTVYGDQYFPTVPDQLVVAHFNADQQAVWNGLQKVDFGFWHPGGVAEQNDGWWGGEEPAKPAVAAPRLGIGFF